MTVNTFPCSHSDEQQRNDLRGRNSISDAAACITGGNLKGGITKANRNNLKLMWKLIERRNKKTNKQKKNLFV